MVNKRRFLSLMAVIVCTSLMLSACGIAPAPQSSSEEPVSESTSESSSSSLPEPSSSEAESSSSSSEASAPQEPESSSQSSSASQSASQPPAPPSSSLPEPSSSAAESKPEEQSQPPASKAPGNLGVAAPALSNDGEYLRDVESQVIDYINEERSRLGLSELTYDANLRSSARIRSAEMYENDYFAHSRPGGEGWQTVLKVEVPIRYSYAAENIAALKTPANYANIESAYYWYTQWEESAPHYAAMIDPRYTHVGVGIVYVYDGGLYLGYATTHFAAY